MIKELYTKETGKRPAFKSAIGQVLYNDHYIKWLERRCEASTNKPCNTQMHVGTKAECIKCNGWKGLDGVNYCGGCGRPLSQ